jgi:hypothetical protein
MAIDVRKLNLPSLAREEVSSLSNKSKFPEDLAGTHREAVLAYDYLPLEKGKGKGGKDVSASFQAKVKLLDSTSPNHKGRSYTLRFWLGGDSASQKYKDRERKGFLAACAGFTTDDFEAEFAELEGEEKETAINEKYLDIEQQLIDASEKGELADGSTIIIHTRSVTSKAVDVVKVVNGKKEVAEETKNYARDYFTPDAS